MLLPNRHASSAAYRYGFGGHEKDDEIKGAGNHYDFGGYGLDVRTGRRFQTDPVVNHSLSQYAVFNNNPIFHTDPTGMSPEKELPNSFKGKLAKGDWREDDRINETQVFKDANKFNLKKEKGFLEYETIEQRVGFYKWFQHSTEAKGYDTKWAGAAFVVASQMSSVHFIGSSWIDNDVESDIKIFAERGNKDIFNDAFGKLRKLYEGPILKGSDALEWDINTLTEEQRDIVGPTYFEYQKLNPKITQTLSKMAKGEGLFGIGVAKSLRFNPKDDIMDWRNRFNHGMKVSVPFWNKYYSKKK